MTQERSDFVLWRLGRAIDGVCKLTELGPIEKAFEIDEGKPRLAGWRDDVTAQMSARHPKDVGLADSLTGVNSLVVSQRVKSFLDGEGIGMIEYLPIRILDHGGKVAARDYFILSPLEVIDCIDKEASRAKMNPISAEDILSVVKLVLREPDIASDKRIFRLASWPGRIVVRRELAEKMDAAGLTGLSFVEPTRYRGLG